MLVATLLAFVRPAAADELVVGALRDQDGRPVAGAQVVARDAGGSVLGRDRSAADGTFALSVPVRPVTLDIRAADTDPQRVRVPAAGPVVAILPRHRAADLIPTVADLAALPAGDLASLASVVPERFTGYNGIDDRGLGGGYGAVTIAGLPFYRRGDGADATSLLPDHAAGSLSVTDPLDALWYGDRAGGGVIDADPFDRQDTVRATDRDALVAGGGDPTAILATSWDPDGVRQLAGVRATGSLGPVQAAFVALAGDTPDATYGGVGLDLRTATTALDLGAHLALTRDAAVSPYDAPSLPDVGSVAELDLDASARGPDALAVRLRWLDEQDLFEGGSGAHEDAALVIGTTRGSAVRTTIALALAYGADRDDDDTRTGLALLPSISAVAPLSADWTAHAGLGDATIGIPGTAIARSSLGQAGLSYADHRRLLGDVIAYADGTDDPDAVVRGYAASLGWEFAPLLSLRAWAASDGDVYERLLPIYAGGPLGYGTADRTTQRQLLWLTWDVPLRLDLLVRNGALEGAARIPFSSRFALAVGSYRRGATRVFSVGVTGR
ncbi:MAG TPA: carboxypeptidase-like regulatory domain-containing protein [Candidatus Sulfotelmatobacter sp.]|nr:carboxypeptidase-like regulatory domain-containing protein [Candidatus Sulfotelmatobacter sp.]